MRYNKLFTINKEKQVVIHKNKIIIHLNVYI